jgi:phage-related protein
MIADVQTSEHNIMTWGFSSIKKALNKAGSWISGAAKDVYSAAKPVVNTVYSDARGVVNFAGNQISKTADTERELVSNLGKSGSNLINDVGGGVKSLSEGISNALPYIVGGAVVIGGMYMFSGGSGKRQYSRYVEDGRSGKRTKYSYGL